MGIIEAFGNVGATAENGGEGELLKLRPALNLVHSVKANEYDREAAEILARVSAWEYSDARTFATVMANHGFKNSNFVSVNVTNPALLVDSKALLIQSQHEKISRRLVILCFRGSEPQNAVNWMTDVSARQQALYSEGYVHAGFHRALVVLWPMLRPLIEAASKGQNICAAAASTVEPTLGITCVSTTSEQSEQQPQKISLDADSDSAAQLAFYLCGHSLGGALAALAGAYLYMNHPMVRGLKLLDHLRGVYTYGQPMIGDSIFAARFHDSLGKNLFRHVFKRDIVPHMPPRTVGRYEHIGSEYHATNTGWVYEPTSVTQKLMGLVSNLVGLASFGLQEIFSVRLPTFTWADHLPEKYLRTAILAPAGEELI
jgi:hypothetical protein